MRLSYLYSCLSFIMIILLGGRAANTTTSFFVGRRSVCCVICNVDRCRRLELWTVGIHRPHIFHFFSPLYIHTYDCPTVHTAHAVHTVRAAVIVAAKKTNVQLHT